MIPFASPTLTLGSVRSLPGLTQSPNSHACWHPSPRVCFTPLRTLLLRPGLRQPHFCFHSCPPPWRAQRGARQQEKPPHFPSPTGSLPPPALTVAAQTDPRPSRPPARSVCKGAAPPDAWLLRGPTASLRPPSPRSGGFSPCFPFPS